MIYFLWWNFSECYKLRRKEKWWEWSELMQVNLGYSGRVVKNMWAVSPSTLLHSHITFIEILNSISSSQHLLFIKVYCFQDKINAIKLDQNLFLLESSFLVHFFFDTFVNVHHLEKSRVHSRFTLCSPRRVCGERTTTSPRWWEWIKTRQVGKLCVWFWATMMVWRKIIVSIRWLSVGENS